MKLFYPGKGCLEISKNISTIRAEDLDLVFWNFSRIFFKIKINDEQAAVADFFLGVRNRLKSKSSNNILGEINDVGRSVSFVAESVSLSLTYCLESEEQIPQVASWVNRIDVTRKFQNQGLGTLLLSNMEALTRQACRSKRNKDAAFGLSYEYSNKSKHKKLEKWFMREGFELAGEEWKDYGFMLKKLKGD